MIATGLGGGLMGFVRRGSMPSLIAGASFGLLYGTSGYLIANNMNGGNELSTATSVLICVTMIPKALRTRKRMLSLYGT